MTRKSSRLRGRALPAAVLLTTTALGLSACSGGDASGGEQTGPVELTMATPRAEGAEENYYQSFIDDFEEQHPEVTIEIVETPNDQHGQTMRTQLQGGNAPDLFYVVSGSGDSQSWEPLAEAGYLHDLTDQQWAADAVPESARDLYLQDDKQYALPVDLTAATTLMNTGVMEELGIEPATTRDELLDQCTTARDAGKSLFALAGGSAPNAGYHALQVAASTVYASDPQWDAKRAEGETTFASSDWKQVLEQIVEFNDAGCYQDGVAGAGFDQLFPSVAQGRATTVFAPAGAIAALRAQVPDGEFEVGVLPGEEADDSRLLASPVNALAVNEASEHKDTAVEFLEFLAQPENQNALAEANGNISIQAALSDAVPEQYPLLAPYFEQQDQLVTQPSLVWPNGVYEELGKGVQGLLTGQATVDQVLESLDAVHDRGA